MATAVIHHIDTKAVFIYAWEVFRKYYPQILLASIVITLLQAFFQQVVAQATPTALRFIVNPFITALLYIPQAIALYILNSKEHQRPVSLQSTIRQFYVMFAPLFLVSLILNILVVLGFVLLVVPGIILLLVFGQAPFFVLLLDTPVREAFTKSMKLTKGNRLNLLKIGFFFVVVYLPLALTLGRYSVGISSYIITLFFFTSITAIGYAMWAHLQQANPTK